MTRRLTAAPVSGTWLHPMAVVVPVVQHPEAPVLTVSISIPSEYDLLIIQVTRSCQSPVQIWLVITYILVYSYTSCQLSGTWLHLRRGCGTVWLWGLRRGCADAGRSSSRGLRRMYRSSCTEVVL